MTILKKIIGTLSTEPLPSDDFEIMVLRAFLPYQEYFPNDSFRCVIEEGLKHGSIVREGECLRVVRPNPSATPVANIPDAKQNGKFTSPWKMIETAPLDGTSILVGYGNGTLEHLEPVVAFYGNYHSNSPGKACWRCSHTRAKIFEPSYWMAIPPFSEED